jgi:ABC-type multidrug transport system permease subunit
MIEILETMPDIELALLIIGVFALILGIVLGYAMVHEYKMYLEEHRKARFSFLDFIKMGHFYIFLFFGTLFIMLANLLYFLE